MRPMVPIEPYWQRIRRLRLARKLSQERLYRATEGVSMDMIRALEADPRRMTKAKRQRSRYPSAATLARVANALQVPPEEFPEYRLALARDRLDDRIVGLEQALETLKTVEQQLLG
jgi:transcriptional regulator with XRE-family HTH domain